MSSLAKVAMTPLSILHCPTRRPAIAYPNFWNPYNITPVSTTAHTDYAGSTGSSFLGFWTGPPQNGGNPSIADAPGFVWPTNFASDGVIYTLSTTRMGEITDGASNTYLIGEKYLNPDRYYDGEEASDNNPCYGGFDWDYDRWTSEAPLPDQSGTSDNYAFGSAHANGFHMALCDGSVHAMNYSIDLLVHDHLGNRADGATIDGKSF